MQPMVPPQAGEERKKRSAALRQAIAEEDITDWFCRQLADLKGLAR